MKKFLKYTALAVVALLLLWAGYFFTVRKLDNGLPGSDFRAAVYAGGAPQLLPSRFINGERFYIKIPMAAGDTALGFGDTGGGISMLLPDAVRKLHLEAKVRRAMLKGVMPAKYILFSDVAPAFTPAPLMLRGFVLRTPIARVAAPFLYVPPVDDELKFLSGNMALDIFLGQNFFMGKAWTFDYLNQQVWVNTPIPAGDATATGVQKLGFKKNEHGDAAFGHPSMSVTVEGEKIDVLFDAGATIILSDSGRKTLTTDAKTIGGSFIAASIFSKWRKEHPEWKYYAKADMSRDVIEVPEVEIGGNKVGPVLFAERPDKVWSEWMIATMDKVVKGAIGGSALKYLKVTIDYNSELIKFEK